MICHYVFDQFTGTRYVYEPNYFKQFLRVDALSIPNIAVKFCFLQKLILAEE